MFTNNSSLPFRLKLKLKQLPLVQQAVSPPVPLGMDAFSPPPWLDLLAVQREQVQLLRQLIDIQTDAAASIQCMENNQRLRADQRAEGQQDHYPSAGPFGSLTTNAASSSMMTFMESVGAPSVKRAATRKTTIEEDECFLSEPALAGPRTEEASAEPAQTPPEQEVAVAVSSPRLQPLEKADLKVDVSSGTVLRQMSVQIHREVYCRINIFNIRAIDVKSRSIHADFYVEASWEEPSLLDDDGSLTQEVNVNWGAVWDPKITFMNKMGDLKIASWYAADSAYYEWFGQPMCSWRAKVSGEFAQTMDLRSFPYDSHDVELILSSDHIVAWCTLLPNAFVPSAAQTESFMVRNSWNLDFDPLTAMAIRPDRRGSGGHYPQLSLITGCSRNPAGVLSNIILIMFAIICFFFISVFTTPLQSIANRNQLAAALLLTAVALKVMTSDKLPDLPYLTFVDKYMLGCISILIFGTFINVIMYYWHVTDVGLVLYRTEFVSVGAAAIAVFAWICCNYYMLSPTVNAARAHRRRLAVNVVRKSVRVESEKQLRGASTARKSTLFVPSRHAVDETCSDARGGDLLFF